VIRVLVTGARGQVGAAVAGALAGRAEVRAHDRATLDLASPDALRAFVRAERPQLIVNAAAYTAVDRAESEPEAARAVNALAPAVLAEEARRLGALLVHYSTDYVFDGTRSTPYVEDDAAHPLGAYGRTKLEGEQAIAASGCRHLVLRTSWVYAPRGKNFLLTMLQLAGTREEVRVVDDQVGAPTSSLQLARATLAILAGGAPGPLPAAGLEHAAACSGLYHATAAGAVSWHGFAAAIFERWTALSPQPFRAPRLVAIASRDYPTPTARPANSRLDCSRLAGTFGVRMEPWEEGLEEVLRVLRDRE
jgi:dTDP-4-dehydrorhamnose reductase